MFGTMWPMQNVAGVELQGRIGVLAARIHAATAELVKLAAELDDDGAWAESGMRSCAHWLSINIGVDLYTGGEMVRAGHALETLPLLRAAFEDGRLSFDKIRAVTKVATPADDEVWTSMALHASGAQLARICRGVRQALDVDDRAGPVMRSCIVACARGGVTTGCSSSWPCCRRRTAPSSRRPSRLLRT